MATSQIPAYLQDIEAIDLEVTSACNASCSFCPREVMPDTKTFMSLEVVDRLADELRRYSQRKGVVLCGIGESTLHPQLELIVEKLNQAGAYVNMTTHGGRMTTERFENLVRRGLLGINFSLNAFTKDVHREVMRLKNFEQIVANLLEILPLRKRLYPKVLIHVSFVVCDANQHQVAPFVEFWRNQDVTKVWLHPVNNRAGLLTPEVKAVQMDDLARRYKKDDRVIVDVFGHQREEGDLCKIAKSMIFISADGQMRLCALDYRRTTSYGNLRDKTVYEMHSKKLMSYLMGELDSFCHDCDFCPSGIRQRGKAMPANDDRVTLGVGRIRQRGEAQMVDDNSVALSDLTQ